MNLSGAPTVSSTGLSDNTTDSTADIYLAAGKVITLNGALTYAGPLKIGMKTLDIFISGWSTYMSSATPSDYFKGIQATYTAQQVDNDLLLVNHTHGNWSYALNGTTLTATCSESGCYLTDSKCTAAVTVANDVVYNPSGTTCPVTVDTTGWVAGSVTVVDNNSNNEFTSDNGELKGSAVIKVNGTQVGEAIPYTISKANLTITGATVSDKTYDGTNSAAVTAVTFDKAMLEKNLDYTVTGTFPDADVDNANVAVTVTVTLSGDALNYYTLENLSYVAQNAAKINAKPSEVSTVPTAQSGLVYDGAEKELITAGTAANGTMRYSLDNSNWSTDIPTGTDAKTYTVYYKSVGTGNYCDSAEGSVNVTIAKAAGSVTAPTAIENLVYTGSPQALINAGSSDTGTVKYKVNDGAWSETVPEGTDAGTYTVYYMVEDSANYNEVAEASLTVTIAPAPLTVEGTASATAVYGTKLKDIEISGLTVKFGGTEVPGIWAFSGETILDVGTTANQTAAFTPSTGAGNYNVLTKEIVPIITKATYGDKTASGSAKYGNAGTVDLTGLIVDGGTATYQSHTNSNNALAGIPSVSGKTLNFQFVDNAALATKTEEIVVKVTSNNYEDYTITVTVTVTDKVVPVVTAPTAITGLIYNGSDQTLINAGSTTGGELQYSLTSGSGYSAELPKATNAGSYTVYYKVVGNDDYADVAENSITATITAKAVTAAPKNVTITKGNAIPAFELVYTGLVGSDTLMPSETPSFTCFEADGTTAVSTSTAAGTYTITWTNMGDTTFTSTNYAVSKTATGTLTINNPAPSGGGGGSYTPPTYKVESEVTVETDGSVSLSTDSAKKGDTVTITVTPDPYYQVEEVIVKDSNGKIIEVTENKDGTFSFEMPASKVTVEPVFSWDNPFADVSEEAYYTPAVEWALKNNSTKGTGDGTTFSPDAACTRAQMVTFLHRVADTQKPEGSTNPFADVPDTYYTEAVQWAYEQKITGGTSATTFSPDADCTRAQMVTFLYRYFEE